MQTVLAVIFLEIVGLIVEVEGGVGDAVCDAADGGAEVRGVVGGEVGGFGAEVEDEVVRVEEEVLEDGAGGEEFEGGGGHLGGVAQGG